MLAKPQVISAKSIKHSPENVKPEIIYTKLSDSVEPTEPTENLTKKDEHLTLSKADVIQIMRDIAKR